MKSLPYFRWYPADAKTDEFYAGLTFEERGFYHHCLNHSWLNNGLPLAPKEMAIALGVSSRTQAKLWPNIRRVWIELDGRWHDLRQEKERKLAKTRQEQSTDAVRARYKSVTPRAYEYECVSESVYSSEVLKTEKTTINAVVTTNQKPEPQFAEFWELYPLKDGQDLTYGVWATLVTAENEAEVFACLRRYLASDHVARGIVKKASNWLHDCSRDRWKNVWPLAAPKKPATVFEKVSGVINERMAKGEQPW